MLCYKLQVLSFLVWYLQRLYFTTDGVSPYLYNRRDVGGRYSVHRSQVVLGLMYSFAIHSNMTTPSDDEVGIHFTVTRDRNKEYHIYRQISVVHRSAPQLGEYSGRISKDARKCSNVRTLSQSLLLLSEPRKAANSSSALSVRVASYNIWNVNSLQGAGEDYETRLNRLIKVL